MLCFTNILKLICDACTKFVPYPPTWMYANNPYFMNKDDKRRKETRCEFVNSAILFLLFWKWNLRIVQSMNMLLTCLVLRIFRHHRDFSLTQGDYNYLNGGPFHPLCLLGAQEVQLSGVRYRVWENYSGTERRSSSSYYGTICRWRRLWKTLFGLAF